MKSPFIKRLCVSVCAALAAGNAQAVYLSTNGTGQVLIYPYYTVRNGFNTLLSVTNTQNNTKVLKVHFLEGMNGRDVMNFNLFLAPNDTWTAVIADTARGARLLTNDNSCVAPSDLFTETRLLTGTTQTFNEFYNFQYIATRQDNPAFSTLDRTREGYFEIIEMGVIDAALSSTAAQIIGFAKPDSSTTNCAALDAFNNSFLIPGSIQFPNSGAQLMAPPRGGLKGWASLINAASGANYTFRPTVLDGWSSQVAYSGMGVIRGTQLRDAFPAISMVTTPAGVSIVQWEVGRDAVSAVLMRESVSNDFVLDAGTASQTDWIVTFPTKPFYTDSSYPETNSGYLSSPFVGGFSYAATGVASCEVFTTSIVNREGNPSGEDPMLMPFPPLTPPAWGKSSLCGVTNVVPFVGSRTELESPPVGLLGAPAPSVLSFSYYRTYALILGATSSASPLTSPSLRGLVGPNGRATFLFDKSPQLAEPHAGVVPILVSPSGTQTNIKGKFAGLPVIGLMLHNYKNANVVSRYGGVIEHSYSVRVE